jgi:hypothetical protein
MPFVFKCPKRHEFEGPDFEANGKSTKKDCVRVPRNRKSSEVAATADGSGQRYYLETNETICERRERVLANVQKMKAKLTGDQITDHLKIPTVQKRPKLGSTPAFIPI